MNVVESLKKYYYITKFAPEEKHWGATIISYILFTFISMFIFAMTCEINLDGYYECIYVFGYLGIYVANIFSNKNNASFIIPITRKELIMAYIMDCIKWILIMAIVLLFLGSILDFDMYINHFKAPNNFLIIMGLHMFGINLFTFGYSDLFNKICAVPVGYFIFLILGVIEIKCVYSVVTYVTATIICTIIAFLIIVAAFIANYYRMKPRQYATDIG